MADVSVTNKKTGKTEVLNQNNIKPQTQANVGRKIEPSKQPQPQIQRQNSKNQNSVEKIEPVSLFDCVFSFYEGTFAHKKLSDMLNNPTTLEEITSDQLKTFFNLAIEKDIDLKKTRIIAECLTGSSCYNKEKYSWIANLLERVFVHYVKPNFNRDLVLSNPNYSEKELGSLCAEIKKSVEQLKKDSKAKKSGEDEQITEKTIHYSTLENNLMLIAFSWIHYNEKAEVAALLNELSKSVFDITKEGKEEKFIETQSLTFAFTNEGKKNNFAYFLNFFTKKIQHSEKQLRNKEQEIETLNSENKKLKEQLQQQQELTAKFEAKTEQFKTQTVELNTALNNQKKFFQSEAIHLKDDTSKTKGQFFRLLEDELLNKLIAVQKGLERTPPKIEVATVYLEIIIEKIEAQIKCLK